MTNNFSAATCDSESSWKESLQEILGDVFDPLFYALVRCDIECYDDGIMMILLLIVFASLVKMLLQRQLPLIV